MIAACFPETCQAGGRLVVAALRRSLSSAQVEHRDVKSIADSEIVLTVNPDGDLGAGLLSWLESAGKKKLIAFGRLPETLSWRLSLQGSLWPPDFSASVRAAPAAPHAYSESTCHIVYGSKAAKLGFFPWTRAAERFDFTDEWNNLGFGGIRAEGSPWGFAQAYRAPADQELASVSIGDSAVATYASLHDEANFSILWFNRPMGPIDSCEWWLVEDFIANYRSDDLPCQPVISEIPFGFDCAVTMRLDCDEDIESSRALREEYGAAGVPLSLAVHTSLLGDKRHHSILREVVASGGSILSHSATHAPNWGGSYEAASVEASKSKSALEELIDDEVPYAVSPFHQTPPYALRALRDAGYRGCVGGIIRNDPDFLFARAGEVEGLGADFVGHSQQHMLHGDCLLVSGDPIAVSKEAFDLAYRTKTLFGFLDHPFSSRYQYGWSDEKQRSDAHRQLIEHMRSVAKSPLFLSEGSALDFFRRKATAQMMREGNVYRLEEGIGADSSHLRFAAEYKGHTYNASEVVIPV
jgi:hypothetical protein